MIFSKYAVKSYDVYDVYDIRPCEKVTDVKM